MRLPPHIALAINGLIFAFNVMVMIYVIRVRGLVDRYLGRSKGGPTSKGD